MRRVPILMVVFTLPAFCQFGGMSATSNGSTGTIAMTVRPGNAAVSCVTGAPYSGTQTMQSVKTLANGTQMTEPERRPETTYRDSAGRVRSERPIFGGSYAIVTVQDPVAGYSYLFDSANRIAYRVAVHSRPSAPPSQSGPPLGTRTRPNGATNVTESLGMKTISGVSVTGTKTTSTLPAGSRTGNNQPVTTVSETWFSPQLGIAVYAQSTAANGTVTTMSIPDLSTAEPAASLFEIPVGYRVVDETASFTFTVPLANGAH